MNHWVRAMPAFSRWEYGIRVFWSARMGVLVKVGGAVGLT